MTTMMIIRRTPPTPQHTAMMITLGMPSSLLSSSSVAAAGNTQMSCDTIDEYNVDTFIIISVITIAATTYPTA